MDEASINRLVCAIRQTKGMLQLLDEAKAKPETTLGELQDKFSAMYILNPRDKDFFFYNQHQFLTSLLAYVCLPKETFYEQLPEIVLKDLNEGWGLNGLLLNLSLKNFLRHIRNAISHGHVEVTNDLVFTFRNGSTTIVLNHISLHKFCQALAYWCLTKDINLKNL